MLNASVNTCNNELMDVKKKSDDDEEED